MVESDATVRPVADGDTRERILAAALAAFGTEGVAATSLDALADTLGITKQTILYWFPSKQDLFDAVIDTAAADLARTFEEAADGSLAGFEQVAAIVRRVFRLASRRPELLGLVREVTRPGSAAAARLAGHLVPAADRARAFLAREMAAGRLRASDPGLLLVSLYSTVVGVATEVEVQRALGVDPTLRAMVQRRRELLRFLEAALVPAGGD
ncbi:MAG: TetR/AcrR family transcriptional regulator [Actinomyces sp.]|nr:MAG: TetR/AcrR family transcriptional regulator [Actinomyces sp.]